MVVFFILGYLTVALSIILVDSLVGFYGFELSQSLDKGPTAWFCALFWPIALPLILVAVFYNVVSSIRDDRLERAASRRKVIQSLQDKIDQ